MIQFIIILVVSVIVGWLTTPLYGVLTFIGVYVLGAILIFLWFAVIVVLIALLQASWSRRG